MYFKGINHAFNVYKICISSAKQQHSAICHASRSCDAAAAAAAAAANTQVQWRPCKSAQHPAAAALPESAPAPLQPAAMYILVKALVYPHLSLHRPKRRFRRGPCLSRRMRVPNCRPSRPVWNRRRRGCAQTRRGCEQRCWHCARRSRRRSRRICARMPRWATVSAPRLLALAFAPLL